MNCSYIFVWQWKTWNSFSENSTSQFLLLHANCEATECITSTSSSWFWTKKISLTLSRYFVIERLCALFSTSNICPQSCSLFVSLFELQHTHRSHTITSQSHSISLLKAGAYIISVAQVEHFVPAPAVYFAPHLSPNIQHDLAHCEGVRLRKTHRSGLITPL